MYRRRTKTSEPEPPSPESEEVFVNLRNQILTLDPSGAGLAQTPDSLPTHGRLRRVAACSCR
jgi:hypothetical protein